MEQHTLPRRGGAGGWGGQLVSGAAYVPVMQIRQARESNSRSAPLCFGDMTLVR